MWVSKALAASIQTIWGERTDLEFFQRRLAALYLWSSVEDTGTLKQLETCPRTRTKRGIWSPRITGSGVTVSWRLSAVN